VSTPDKVACIIGVIVTIASLTMAFITGQAAYLVPMMAGVVATWVPVLSQRNGS